MLANAPSFLGISGRRAFIGDFAWEALAIKSAMDLAPATYDVLPIDTLWAYIMQHTLISIKIGLASGSEYSCLLAKRGATASLELAGGVFLWWHQHDPLAAHYLDPVPQDLPELFVST